jgi:2-polyprenyl-3-methyl-5-hydroxy-6-metoxy-1,4-benzoquinol methylase
MDGFPAANSLRGKYLNVRFAMDERKEPPSPSPSVVEEVQDFYERYPYPRPVESLESYARQWDDPNRRHTDYHLFWPDQPYRENYSILIAGCGTSQAAKHAMRWPSAKVTGIDFSAMSIHHTEQLKQKYNLKNLQLRQLAIENVEELGTSFDQIVCTGVLHHLPNPDAGLSALRDVLTLDGAMHLMVYAPYGRTGIYMLQEFCRQVGIHATDDGIRDLVTALKSLPPDHPLESLLRQAPDFRHEAALADALLHPQDRAYSVPQLFTFLENAGLTFGRWVKQAPYSIACGVLAKLPQAGQMAQLSPMEQFSAAELFRGTMLRHSAVAYRNDRPANATAIHFSDDRWLRYVPLRMPDTLSIQERLPAGAAAVLINQTHTYRDLFLPISAAEKRILDGIDGRRTIRDVLESTQSSLPDGSPLELVRTFFERLWWQDQVVFDTSHSK